MTRSPLRLQHITELLRVLDFLVVVAAGFFAYLVYPGVAVELHGEYGLAILLGAVICSWFLWLNRVYNDQPHRVRPRLILQVGVAVVSTVAVLAAVAFALKESETFSRIWVLAWVSMSFAMLLGMRVAVALFVRRMMRQGGLIRRAAIFGGGDQGQLLMEYLQAVRDPGLQVVGFFDERFDRVPENYDGIPRLGGLAELEEAAARGEIDTVILALPLNAVDRLLSISNQLDRYPVLVLLAPDLIMWRVFQRESYSLAGIPLPRLLDQPHFGWAGVAKLIEDKVLSLLLILVLLPVYAAIALAIRVTSPGPVLFRQPRAGFNGEIFTIYKFRTMRSDMADVIGARQTTRDDPRVTRVGRFLRRTSLDELPQFVNVLQGDMSLVGPRPHAEGTMLGNEPFDRSVKNYMQRYRVKPGITGWAQVNGWRGQADSPEKLRMRIRYDIEYVDKWSIGLDLYILLITPFVVLFRRENAY
ncbi:undecaprenyl-phosphate glucose phosphotransferase [Amorphus coralli]|uniref:undecaprenyl-phosphate glucose phosphotransferase n=1 Tax=Amorphus coralli TaxID=340680 RepID=UPI000368D180|nr:undecaprenyl-phosphate glucose phosphotransferase [Amorphus coralli]